MLLGEYSNYMYDSLVTSLNISSSISPPPPSLPLVIMPLLHVYLTVMLLTSPEDKIWQNIVRSIHQHIRMLYPYIHYYMGGVSMSG